MEDEPKDVPRSHDLRNILPAEILQFSGSFPLAPVVRQSLDTVKERLRNFHWYLPTAEKAAELRDLYFNYAAWLLVSYSSSLHLFLTVSDLGTTPSHFPNSIQPYIPSFSILRRPWQLMMSPISCCPTGFL